MGHHHGIAMAEPLLIAGPGPGDIYGPHTRGFGADGTPLPGRSFLAYGTNRFGVNVTAGNIDADACDEIVTVPGMGGEFAAHVRGWRFDGSAAASWWWAAGLTHRTNMTAGRL